MTRTRLSILLPALALGAGLAACAPSDPYYATNPGYAPTVVQQGYATPYNAATPYATPMPAYVGGGDAYGRPVPVQQGYAAAPAAADPYCQEAYANAVGTEQRAAATGSPADAARANRSAGFFRRDC
ncbi:hypothetical protein EAH89_11130 [Roseomonas nepalensis]|uniref:Lipoprotein n=1 Tax=Muricoccus nepalensis TaxID=1854500 RepID=A0A502G7V3_9PROT|nr:hypothetical protein [Roseomonas nepalensis]TPG57470.1 hypothetical protein EAH89_11130 [Roseomonas nepalensis]